MKDAIRVLNLIVEKADKLENLSFTRHLLAGGKIGFSGERRGEHFAVQRDGPDEEAIDAFVLTLRFFIQNNEPTSLQNIEKLFSTLPLEPARIEAVAGSRRAINERLDGASHIVLGDQPITRRTIFEVFLWGDLAEVTPIRKRRRSTTSG